MTELRREVRFDPGYDHREDDKGKPSGQRRGQHGMQIRFLLHGDLGTVQFVLGTDWVPTHVVDGPWGKKLDRSKDPAVVRCAGLFPMPVDLGHHWRTPVYEGEYQRDHCEWIDGPCFYDGSGLNADPVAVALFTEGDAGVWRHLEAYYAECAVSSAGVS
jgi:hypothetical protein